MRLFRVACTVAILSLFAGSLVHAQRKGMRATSANAVPNSAASLLPSEVDFFFEIENPADLRDALVHSQMVSSALAAAGAPSDGKAGSPLRTLSLGLLSREKLSGTRLAFASAPGADPQSRTRILLAVAPDAATAIAVRDTLEHWFSEWVTPFSKTPGVSSKYPSDVLKAPDGRTFVSGYDGVASFVGDSSLTDVVSSRLRGGTMPALSQSKEFLDAQSKLSARQQYFGFFSKGAITEIAQQILQSLDADSASLGRTAFDFAGLDGIEAVGIGGSFGPNGAAERFEVFPNTQSQSILNVLFHAANERLEVFQNATKDATTAAEYHFDYTELFGKLLDIFGPLLAVQAGAESASDAVASYEKQFGFKIREELLPALGSGVTIVLEPSSSPVASANESLLEAVQEHGVLLLPVRDKLKFASVLEKVRLYMNRTKDGSAPVLKPPAEYRGVQVIYERGAAMAYLGTRFAIAREANLKRLIGARAAGETLSKAPDIVRMFGGPTAASAGAMYLNASHGSSAARNFVGLLTGLSSDQIDFSPVAARPFLMVNLSRTATGLAGKSESPVGILGGLLTLLRSQQSPPSR